MAADSQSDCYRYDYTENGNMENVSYLLNKKSK